jgi:hypothetical protein
MTRRRKTQGKVPYQDQWCIPDDLWARIEPLLPPHKPPPLGCHRQLIIDQPLILKPGDIRAILTWRLSRRGRKDIAGEGVNAVQEALTAGIWRRSNGRGWC